LRKTIVASDGESSLAQTLRKFRIGILAEPDTLEALRDALEKALAGAGPAAEDWDRYLEYANWTRHAEVVIDAVGVFKLKTEI
jgi:hypothetical protein